MVCPWFTKFTHVTKSSRNRGRLHEIDQIDLRLWPSHETGSFDARWLRSRAGGSLAGACWDGWDVAFVLVHVLTLHMTSDFYLALLLLQLSWKHLAFSDPIKLWAFLFLSNTHSMKAARCSSQLHGDHSWPTDGSVDICVRQCTALPGSCRARWSGDVILISVQP